MIDYSYLHPPGIAEKLIHPKQYIFEYVDSKPRRRIFENVEYQPFEKEAIRKLKEYLEQKKDGKAFSDHFLLKVFYLSNFTLSESISNLNRYRQLPKYPQFQALNHWAKDILEEGLIYTYGRDYHYCPVIYVLPLKIHKKYQISDCFAALNHLLHLIQKHMLVGASVESWVVILDFQKQTLTAETKQFHKQLKQICLLFPFRLKSLFYLNSKTNPSLEQYLQEFMSHGSPNTQIKNIKELKELHAFIPAEQRELKYGGTLSNLYEFWPIHSTNKYQEQHTVMYDKESVTEFESVLNDQAYFEDKKLSFCDMNCTIF